MKNRIWDLPFQYFRNCPSPVWLAVCEPSYLFTRNMGVSALLNCRLDSGEALWAGRAPLMMLLSLAPSLLGTLTHHQIQPFSSSAPNDCVNSSLSKSNGSQKTLARGGEAWAFSYTDPPPFWWGWFELWWLALALACACMHMAVSALALWMSDRLLCVCVHARPVVDKITATPYDVMQFAFLVVTSVTEAAPLSWTTACMFGPPPILYTCMCVSPHTLIYPCCVWLYSESVCGPWKC